MRRQRKFISSSLSNSTSTSLSSVTWWILFGGMTVFMEDICATASCHFTYCPYTKIQIQLVNTYDGNQKFEIYGRSYGDFFVYPIIIRNRENSPFQFSYDGPCATFSLVAYCSSDDSNYGVSCSSSFVITGATLPPVTTSVRTNHITCGTSWSISWLPNSLTCSVASPLDSLSLWPTV